MQLLLTVVVLSAAVQDRDGAKPALLQLPTNHPGGWAAEPKLDGFLN